MGRIDELVSAEFAAWEQRGRGWQVWPQPVRPEPAFAEFAGYHLPDAQRPVDDGIRATFFASLFDSIQAKLNRQPVVEPEEIVEPEPVASEEPLTEELVVSLPSSLDLPDDALRSFLDSLHGSTEPTGFELLGTNEGITIQFAASPQDAPALQRQLQAFLPKLPLAPAQSRLAEAWTQRDGVGFIVDFGLAHEFMLLLQTGHAVDPFVGLVAALNELQRDEVAVFQVLFQPVQNPWPPSVWKSVTDAHGKALFVNRLQLIPGTKAKLEQPLFGVVVRAAAKAETFERSAAIVREMAEALRSFSRMEANRLIPLTNDEYPFELHEEDLILRQSRRSGMLLNRDELLGFVHLPSDEVRAPRLCRERTQTKAAPASALASSGILLGHNRHAGRSNPVRLTADQRVKHLHLIGASGTGKSTLLFNLIQQDIESGQGLAVLDPHGDLVNRILEIIPPHRLEDVILIDPTDEEYSIGFNILSAHSDFEKNLLASDLVSIFRRLSSSWGDQLNSVLNNAIRAFLESTRGGTLSELQRFLLDPGFRNEFLETVRDPDVVFYWRKAFPQLGGNKSIGPVLTRLDAFLGPKPIRYMVSQTANHLDFSQILDTGKIVLAKLSQGQIGKENAFLLGSLLVSKFQQLAMSRQRLSVEERRDFWLYLDEFPSFLTPSMAEILAGARKYRLGLILAHQELQQLQRDSDVASAVMSNPYARVVFRVGDSDANALAKGFASFDAKDLLNLETGEAIGRLERSDRDFNLTIPLPVEIDPESARHKREAVIQASHRKYATPRAEIEAALLRKLSLIDVEEPAAKPKTKPTAPPLPHVADPTASEVPQPTGSEKVSVEPPVEVKPAKVLETMAPIAPKEVKPPESAGVAPVTVLESATAPKPETPKPPYVPAEMGIGGAQHQTTQKRIKKAAEELGFLATIEKPIPNGNVDVLLERQGQTIACEIGVTTPVDQEFRNLQKCLAAGFPHVAMISRPERLRQIAEAVQTALGAEPRVGFYTPDEFITHLQQLPVPPTPSPAPTQTIRRGRTVTVKTRELSPAERREKEAARIALLAEIMRAKP